MKRSARQASSIGFCWRTVEAAWENRPRPAQSSPSIGTAGQASVNHAGAAMASQPRTPSYFSLTQ